MSFESACLVIEAALKGDTRRDILVEVSKAKTFNQSMMKLRDVLRANRFNGGAVVAELDSLTRKDATSQVIGKGFELDVHCADGAPKESFVKFEKAEDGGESGTGLWYPLAQGFRPSGANAAMQQFLKGGYITVSEG